MNDAAVPAYPARHSGCCLVCGNAWTLADDLERAHELRPGAAMMTVNGAAASASADFLFSLHFEMLPHWIATQTHRFGRGFTTHGVGSREHRKQVQRRREAPFVDYWWPDAKGAGTSAWSGAKLARLMGFDEIVLCGAPLAPGPHADGSAADDFLRRRVLEHYRAAVIGDVGWHRGVTSMSGWTKEFFGEPV